MIVGGNATSAINYVYHLIMGRLLGPVSYGELASLFSLIGLIAVLPGTLGLAIVKQVSVLKTDEDRAYFVSWFSRKVFFFSITVVMVVIILFPIIEDFLKVSDSKLIILTGMTFLFSLPSLFNRAVLQGLLNFKKIIFSILLENTFKLLVGVGLVLVGFSLYGAMIGFVVATAVGWWISNPRLSTTKSLTRNINLRFLFTFSGPVLVQSLSTASLVSTDLILVKHFLSSADAGIYAALSNLGKIILYGTGPISAVMFPIVSSRHSQGLKYMKVFIYSLLATVGIVLGMMVFYLLFPKIAISILYGAKYLSGEKLLILFGGYMSLFTLSSLFINYYLSIGRLRIVLFPAVAAIFQIIGIWFYHSSILSVILVSITVCALLLFSLFVYLLCESKNVVSNCAGL